jgi:hypothetical protein
MEFKVVRYAHARLNISVKAKRQRGSEQTSEGSGA